MADFLDDLRWAPDQADVVGRIDTEPEPVDPRTDASLGALAEHVAGLHQVVAPAWTAALGSALDAAGVTADLYVVGGAANAPAYDERRATRRSG